MLLALALMGQGLAQDMKLNADATQAIGCGRAIVASVPQGTKPTARIMLQTVYFMMGAADADAGTEKRYVDRVTELAPQIFNGPKITTAEAGAVLTACDKRFPLWRGTAPAKLPSDPYTRDVMCAGTIAYAYGFLKSINMLDGGPDYQALLERLMERIPNSVFAAHGVVDQESTNAALETALRGSLRVGNLDAMTTACTLDLDRK